VLHSDRPPSSAAKTAILAGLIIIALVGGIALDRFWLQPGASAPTESAEPEGASDELKLEPGRIRNAGIGLLRVAPGDLSNQIIAQATVAATPEGAAVVGARADGTVTEIRKRLGDHVVKGEVLGIIQSREAAKLAEERGKSQARLVRAQQAFERQKHLLAANATSRQDYDAAEAEWRIATAELVRANSASTASGAASDGVSLNIISPVSGRITAASAALGNYVVAGTELFRVADPTKLEVRASLPTADAQRVSVDDAAVIDLPDGSVAAKVRAITDHGGAWP
jgi:cobalt-zinc-cadmium efflux system membrane fusion protein